MWPIYQCKCGARDAKFIKKLAAQRPLSIALFFNRKHAKKSLFNRKKLSQVKEKYSFNANNNHFFISENLTKMNEVIWCQGRKLIHSNLINAWYSRDVVVTIKKAGCFNPIKVFFMNELYDIFPNFNFEVDDPFHDASPDVSAQSSSWVREDVLLCITSLRLKLCCFVKS